MIFIRSACCSHRGTIRGTNEDNFAFDRQLLLDEKELSHSLEMRPRPLSGRLGFGVFDGMGGLSDGEKASRTAAGVFIRSVGHSSALEPAFWKMNRAVRALARGDGHELGTTAAVILFSGGSVAIGNVGDSRVYLWRACTLKQLSEDHTDHVLLTQLGITTRAPTLTQYIGMPVNNMEMEPHISKLQIKAGDRFLLCSDGLTSVVPDTDIASVCAATSMAGICVNKLVQMAIKNGSRDNITVLACDLV